ncbi:glycosyltransferase family 2 protein [Paenibacillus mesotrionivorans]|uniref:Glycosyltransferase family 2 protein n=1 Tax=Paenibacillus mesotrionivorans TaxID=3160968 RepID=A0ACC7P8I9_9BACL
MPLISVILVTYNRMRFLSLMLDSLRSQSFVDYELVLVNNGSTDGTAPICQAYVEADSRIKLITIPHNMGASHGRNQGLSAASGEYVTFVDDDDYCYPDMLSFLARLVHEDDVDIAMCGSYNDFGDRLEPYFIGEERIVLDRLQGLRELLQRRIYNVAPPTKLFRRELWEGMAFPHQVLVDDIHIIYKVFERARRLVVWNRPMYAFRKHTSNMTVFIHNRRITPKLLDEYLTMYQTRAYYLLERAPEIAEAVESSIYSYMHSMCQLIAENSIAGCETQLRFMQDYVDNNRFDEIWVTGTGGEPS